MPERKGKRTLGDSLRAATPGQGVGFPKNDLTNARRKRPHYTVSMAPKVWDMFHPVFYFKISTVCVWRSGSGCILKAPRSPGQKTRAFLNLLDL